MQTLVIVIVFGVAVGAVAWIVVIVRRYGARKKLEKERAERFLADMMRSPPAAAPAPAAAATAPAASPAAAAPTDPIAKAVFDIRNALAAGRAEAAAKAFLAVVGERTKLTLEPA